MGDKKGDDKIVGYWGLMGLQKNAPYNSQEYKRSENAFNRAHEIRRFEIELYWKRANYFWLLQAAVFTAFALLMAADEPNKIPKFLPLAIVCLGFLCAYAGYLSAEGSKFWQKNWEKHIDNLEDEYEGRLHKTVWIGCSGVKHSVSRVNSKLILCFVWLWFIMATYLFAEIMMKNPLALEYRLCRPLSCKIDPNPIMAILSLALTLFAFIIIRSQWTNFSTTDEYKEIKSTLKENFIRYSKSFIPRLVFTQPKWQPIGWLKRRCLTAKNE